MAANGQGETLTSKGTLEVIWGELLELFYILLVIVAARFHEC